MKKIYLVLLMGFLSVFAKAQISGIAFRDFNANGIRTTSAPIEPLLSGIKVILTLPSGTVLLDTTDNLGAYAFTAGQVPSGTKVRLEFVNLNGSGDSTSFINAAAGSNGSNVQFATAGTTSTNINYAVNNQYEFYDVNAKVASTMFASGDPQSAVAAGNTSTLNAIASAAYSVANDAPWNTANTMVTQANVGPVWGLAYARKTKQMFAASFTKRHAGYGPGGFGAIYKIDYTTGSPTKSIFVKLDTMAGVSMGTPPARSLPASSTTPSLDLDIFPQVGKIGLGDIDISDDDQFLYIINLSEKKLHRLSVANPNSSNLTTWSIPDPGCSNGEFRPFACKYYKGKVYVGVVCSNQSSNARDASFTATVYEFNQTTGVFTSVLNFPLTYPKGSNNNGAADAAFADSTRKWYPWTDDPSKSFLITYELCCAGCGTYAYYPQPMLTDIEFDINGEMILGFEDRFGHQYGGNNYFPKLTASAVTTIGSRSWVLNTACNAFTKVPYTLTAGDKLVYCQASGDVLRAKKCSPSASTWSVENNAVLCSPGQDSTAGKNIIAAGIGNYYYGVTWNTHEDLADGGLSVMPGSGEMVCSMTDPGPTSGSRYWEGGVSWNSNTTGAKTKGLVMYPGANNPVTTNWNGYFMKANGMGDVELLASPAPIQIGNRVWLDNNNNGLQDPDESGLPSVAVVLRSPGVNNTYGDGDDQTWSTTTNASGIYSFDSTNMVATDLRKPAAWAAIGRGLLRGYDYRLEVDTTALLYYKNVAANAGSNDGIDNDATPLGSKAVINFNTNIINHSFDFGFTCKPIVVSSAAYTQATCPVPGITANNNASMIVTANGDKVAISATGIPATIYASASALVTGSFNFTALSGTADSFFVRVFNGPLCTLDTVIKVTKIRCCPTITFGTPAANTAYCSGAKIPSLIATTNAKAPDQIKYYLYSTQKTNYSDIVNGGGTVLGTSSIVGVAATVSNTATLTNAQLPTNYAIPDTMYIYAVYVDASTDTTCKIFTEKAIILNPEPIASITANDFACNSTAVSLTSGYATTYKWGLNAAATVLSAAQTYSPIPAINTTSNYWLVVSNAFGCASDTAHHLVTTGTGILGTVYGDYNSNGIKETNEIYGVAGVTVNAYSTTGSLLATTTSNDEGRYFFTSITPAMGKVRIEFVKSTLPSGYTESFSGTNNGTDVQFVTAPNCAVNWGVKKTTDYCGTNAKIVTPIFIDGATATNTTGLNDGLYSLKYSDYTLKTTEATRTEIGATWGIGYAKQTKKLYAASFLKRHVGLKDGKLGQIFVTDFATAGTPTTLWLDVSTLGLPGTWQFLTDAQRGLGNAGTPSRDSVAFSNVASSGLGDIDVSEDETQLYAMDLINKQLLVIDIATKTLVGSYPVPSVCSGTATPSYYTAYPFTFTSSDGKLWKNGYYFNTDNNGAGYAQTITNPNNIAAGTSDAALYTNSIYSGNGAGNFLNYQFPMGNGTYSVKLHLATNGLPNNTNFNVISEGATVFSNVNVYAEAGNVINKGITKTFTATVTDGILDIKLAGNAGTLVLISGFEITPTSGQASGQTRPFAIKPYNGKVYVGSVCDASGSQSMSDLTAGVYEFDPITHTFNPTPVLTVPLNYVKGPTVILGVASALRWFPWTSVYPNNTIGGIATAAGGFDVYNQPVLSDIEFDMDGSMILGFFDRWGHQMGSVANYKPNGQGSQNAAVGGDLLRAYFNGSSFELENNAKEGTSSSKSPSAGAFNNQGPGSGEFYFGDHLGGNANGAGTATGHYEILMGGLAFLPGSGEIRATVGDALAFSTGALASFNNNTGDKQNSFTMYSGTAGGVQQKSNGLGDLEILCGEAPLQIGNYVWIDANNDGIQEANESPVANVTIKLCKGGVVIATTTTNANGEYYFSSKNVAGVTWTGTGADTTLLPNTAYELKLDTTAAGQHYGIATANSTLNNGNDQNDADAIAVGGNAVISLTTGAAGSINHTYDFGLKCVTPNVAINYTPATCPAVGITALNTASLQVITDGDKVACSITGVPTTTYALASVVTAGSFTFTAQNGTADSFYVRVFSGPNCAFDTIIVVHPVKCCPTISAIATPATNTVYCGESTIPAFNVTTNAIAPDSIRLVYFNSAQTNPSVIYNGPTLAQKVITGVAASGNTANFTNIVIPASTSTSSDTLWIYAIYIDHNGDTTCKISQPKSIIRKPQGLQVIYGYDKVCTGGPVTLSTNGALTYQWGSVSPASSTLGTTQSITVNPTTATTYWVKGTNAIFGCTSDTAFYTVTTGSGIFGSVYYDFNSNGIQESNELAGAAGITVRAFDNTGAVVATATTDSKGRYQLASVTPAMGKVRVEFDKSTFPAGYNSSFNGTNNGTDVQFVTANECTANLGLFAQGQYCQNSPNIALVRFERNNNPTTNTTISMMGVNAQTQLFTPYSTSDANYLWGLPSLSTGYPANLPVATQTILSTVANSGTTFGLAYDRKDKLLFTGSFMRSFAPMKANSSSNGYGEGVIYSIPVNGPTAGTPAPWLDLETLLGNGVAGVYLPDVNYPGPADYGRVGTNPNKIGYTGLGVMEVSSDGSQLYAVNLAGREVLVIPIGAGGTAPTSAAAIKRFPLPTTDVSGTFPDGRPIGAVLGLGVHPITGRVFASLTKTGPTVADLRGYVYSFDPNDNAPSAASFIKELEIPMNTLRPATNVNGVPFYDQVNHPWETVTAGSVFYSNGNNQISQNTHPWLGEIVFDLQPDGTYGMTVAERNRFHDMIAGSFYVAGGSLYKANMNGGSWALENNGVAMPVSTSVNWTTGTATTAGSNTSAGNRFYRAIGVEGTFSAGTLAHIQGSNEVMTPTLDNLYHSAGSGVSWLSTITGNRIKDNHIYGNGTTGGYNIVPFTKANNFGDIEPLCNEAPLQIGNYVWKDSNHDGIQDPNESPLSNIVVTLWKGGTQIASTTTNVKGEYYFSKTGLPGVTWTGTGADTSLIPMTAYEIKIQKNTQPVIDTMSLTIQNSTSNNGNDQNDNDASQVGNYAVISLTTGAAGSINHTYDFGFHSVPCVKPNAGNDTTMCGGTCANLVGTAPTTETWTALGSNPTGATLGTTTSGVAQVCFTNSSTGTYTFIYGNGTCNDTMQIVVNPKPNAGGDQTSCLTGSTVTMSATGTGTWTAQAGNPGTATIVTPSSATTVINTFSAAGVYNFIWTSNGCTDTASVTINANPTADAGMDANLDCTTTSTVIGTAAISGNTYSWSPATGLSATNIAQPIASPSTTTTYTVSVTGSNGCTSTDMVTVNVDHTQPAVNAGANATLNCTTTSTQIGATASGGVTYSWDPSTGLSATNIADPIANPSSTTTYTVTATGSNGCTATSTVTITVNTNAPIADGGNNVTLTCSTTSALIGTSAVSGNTYSWSPSTGLSADNIAQPTASPASTTTYTVTVTGTNGCTASDLVTVTIDAATPTVDAGIDATITCTTPSMVIGTASVSGVTYSWSPASGLSATNIAQPTATPSTTTTYTVTATGSNGCTASSMVTITVDKTAPSVTAGPNSTLDCTTTSTQLGAAAASGVTYSWSPATGLSATNIADPIASPTTTTTYTVTATASNGCTASSVVTLTVNATTPVADAGNNANLDCTTTSVMIGTAAVSGNTYSWSPSTGLSADNIAQPIASPTTTTAYTVTVTGSNGCSATDVVTVNVNTTLPTVDAGIDATITCTTPSMVIGTASVSGVTYSWSPASGLSATNIAQPTATPSTTTTYTVTAAGSNGCTATSMVTITVDNTAPSVTAGANATLDCTTTSMQLGAAAASGVTYSWSPATGLSATNIADPIASPTSTTTYTVTATASNGCTASSVVTLTVNATAPVADAGNNANLDCTTTSAMIGTAAVSGNTYSWSPSTGLSADNIAQPIASPTTTTIYTVTVTGSNGCSASDVVTVNVNTTLPTVSAGATATITCTNASVMLGASSVSGYTYSWSPSTGLSAANIAQPIASPTTSTTYTVTVTGSNGCTASDMVTINVDVTAPIVDAGANMDINCITTSVQIGTPAVVGNTYSWSPAAGLSATNIAEPIASPSTTTTYTVTATGMNGCTATDIVTVTVNIVAPTVDAGANVDLNCTMTSAQIGTTAISGNTYSWTPSIGLSADNIAQPIASPTTTTTYTVTVTGSNGCTASDVVTVNVNTTLPTASAGATATITCTNVSAMLGAASVSGYTYSWSPSTGLSATNIAQPIATPTTSTTYTVTVTSSNGCTASDMVTINVDVTAPIVDAGANMDINCTTTSVQIGTPAVVGNTYSWSPATGLSATNIADPIASPSTTTTYTVTATGMNGCTASDVVTVTVNAVLPIADAGLNALITCIIPSDQIGAPPVSGYTYSWSPSTGLSATNIAQPIVSPSVTTTYTVTVTGSNGCTATDMATVNVDLVLPNIDAGVNATIDCTTMSAQLGVAPIVGTSYSWSPSTGLSATNIAQPIASPSTTTTYTVTASGMNGCTASDVVTITVDVTTPTVDAGANATIDCINVSSMIGTSAIAGTTYSWSPSTGLSATNIAQPIASPSTTTTYTVTATGTNGCTASDVVTITVNTTPPTADAGANKDLNCTTTSEMIGTAAISGDTYSWSPSTGLSADNIAQPIASPTITTTYTVTVTNASGCTASDVMTVTVNTTVPIADAGNAVMINCTTPATQIGTVAISGNTYLWTPSTGLSADNIAQPVASPTTTTTYTVTVTGANGCTESDVVTVTVDTTPPTADAGNNATIDCTNMTAQIGTPGTSGTQYAWSPSAGLSADNIAQPIASPTSTTNYTVTATAPNGCTATDVVEVNVNTTLPPVDAGSNATLTCSMTSTMIGTAPVSGITYTWSPSTGLSFDNIAQPIANPSATTTYTITAMAGSGCTATDVVTISVDMNAPIADAGNNATVNCTTMNVSIGTSAIAGNTYSWSPSTGLSAVNVAQPVANPTSTTTYTVTVTGTNGCTETDVVTVNVDTTPPAADAGMDASLDCTTTSAQIGTPGTSGTTYSWSPSTGLSASNIAQPIASPTTTTTYTVTATGSNGCTSTDEVTVDVNTTLPTADAGTNQTVTCSMTSAQIGTASISGNTYSWSPSLGISADNIAQPMASPTTTTTYTITVTNSNGCTMSDVVTVTVDMAPPTAAAGPDETLTCNVTSMMIGTPAISGNTYSWSPSTDISATNIAQPIASPTSNATYTVTVTGSNGCTSTDDVVITVNTAAPTADAGPNQSITPGGSIGIGTAAISGNTYSWSPSASLNNASIAQPTATPPTTTTYTVTVTNSNGCTETDVVTVTVASNAPGITSYPGTHYCYDDNLVLVANGTPGATFNWTMPAGVTATINNSVSGQSTITVTGMSSASNGYYIVTETVPGFPTSTPDSIYIDAAPKPVINYVTTSCVSMMGEVTVNASGTPSLEYSINGGAFQTSPVLTTLPGSAFIVAVRAVGSSCETFYEGHCVYCTAPGVCAAPPTDSLVVPEMACVSSPINMSAYFTNASNGSWISSGTGIFSTPTATTSPATTTYTPSIADLNNGNVIITFVTNDPDGAGPCVPAMCSRNMLLFNGTVAPSIISNSPVCQNSTMTMAASGAPGNITWNGPSAYTATADSIAINNIQPSMGGTYTATASIPGCPSAPGGSAATSSVTVLAAPNLNVTTLEIPETCYGNGNGSINVQTTGGSGNYTVCYNTTLANCQTGNNVTFNWIAPGYYTVTVVDAQCPANVFSYPVQVAPGAVVLPPSVTGPISICEGDNLILSGTISSPATNILWVHSSTYLSATGNPLTIPNATLAMNGAYYAKAIDANGCASLQVPLDVIVTAKPVINHVQVNCVGTSANVDITASGGTSLTYSLDGTNYQTSNLFTGIAGGNYTVHVKNSPSNCETNLAIWIPNCACPTAPVVNVTAPTHSCSNTPIPVSGTFTNVSNATWSSTGTGNFSVTSGASPLATNYTPSTADLATGHVYLMLTTDDPDGSGPCTPVSQSVYVILLDSLQTPVISTLQSTYCAGDTVVMVANNVNSYVHWTGVGGYVSDSTSAVLMNATQFMSGNYTATVSGNGCATKSETYLLTVAAPPTINVTSSTTPEGCEGQGNGAIHVEATGGTGNYNMCNVTNPTCYVTTNAADFKWLAPTTYTIKVSDVSCPNYWTTITQTVAPGTHVDPPLAVNAPAVCEGEDLVMTVTNPSTGSFLWTDLTNNFTATGQSVTKPEAKVEMSGPYKVQSVVGGCASLPLFFDVLVSGIPTISSVDTFCMGTGEDSGRIVINSIVNGGSAIEYSINNGAFQTSPMFDRLKNGLYSIKARTVGSDCESIIQTVDLYCDCHCGKDNLISVFPNPNTGKFVISGSLEIASSDVSISVYNLLGQTIYMKALSGEISNFNEDIDITSYAAGSYMVKVLVDGQSYIRAITITDKQ